ncbi:hypothetical protein FJY63_08880 [Candidatus Sumerlaeota bacterium]|nr:hypothetical protein [Candidatus Sumerlaeota bacterium]
MRDAEPHLPNDPPPSYADGLRALVKLLARQAALEQARLLTLPPTNEKPDAQPTHQAHCCVRSALNRYAECTLQR